MVDILSDDFLFSEVILSKDQLAAIGSVAIASTNCESMVESMIWAFLGIEETKGKFVTQGMQMKNRLELLLNLAKENLGKNDALIKEFTALKSAMTEANNERNIIIHGTWQIKGNVLKRLLDGSDPANFAPAVAVKRRLHDAPLEFSADEIKKTALRISKLTDDLTSFALQHWSDVLGTSLGKFL